MFRGSRDGNEWFNILNVIQMARIEISMEEYDAMKQKVRNLEEELVSSSKEMSVYKEKYNAMRELVDEIKDTPFFSRVFGWKKIVESINAL